MLFIKEMFLQLLICHFFVASIPHHQEKVQGKRKSTNSLPKFVDFLAEQEGFEPSVPVRGLLDFESSPL